MKKIIVSAAALMSASVATAGSVVFIPPAVSAIEEPARMGGSGAWLIPLIIGAVILLAITTKSDSEPLPANVGQ
ncbi:MAG: hypothetical protein COB08_014890 [Rhodobacteraceae bacterium]|nr:hypothetical protein [Paracoccaceae bacterium]